MEDTPGRLRFMAFLRDQFACIYCGRSSLEDQTKIHVDRLDGNGEPRFENLVTVCRECGEVKGSLPLSNTTLARLTAILKERSQRFREESGLHDG